MVRRLWTLAVVLLFALFMVSRPAAVLAQEVQPQQESQGLMLFTRYPAQEIAIGDSVNIPLTLRTGSHPQIVHLSMQNLPDGWTATFRGDGRVIQAAFVEPEKETTVDLRVEPATDASSGSFGFTVIARGETEETRLPIELIVKDQLPPGLTFDVDLPTLKGTPDTTFRYNATLKNEGDQEVAVNLVAEAPRGLQVDFKLSGQSVTSIPLTANESKSVSVEVKPFPDLPAGSYPINVLVQGGDLEASTTLTADVTGQPELAVTAPDGRLSGQAYAGNQTPIKLIVQNTGSAPARNIELSGSQPAGWSVEFEPKQITELAGGQQVEVTASLHPSDQAVPGDYMVTLRATPEEGPAESAEFRITVLTSTLWGLVGIALIAVAVAVVGLAVMRFGRR